MYWTMINFFSGISDSTTLYCTSHECIFCLHHSLHASLYISSHSSYRAILCNIQFISAIYRLHIQEFLLNNNFIVEINHQNILHKKFLLLHCNNKHFFMVFMYPYFDCLWVVLNTVNKTKSYTWLSKWTPDVKYSVVVSIMDVL